MRPLHAAQTRFVEHACAERKLATSGEFVMVVMGGRVGKAPMERARWRAS
jgi:hypothetical protein